MLTRIFKKLLGADAQGGGGQLTEPLVIPRADHPVSRKQISPNALKVLYRLRDNGFQAFLVGGCIRDILIGQQPKDFDVATDASPDEVRQIFRKCRLIGRRFRLAHIIFGREIIEVATFRGGHESAGKEGRTDSDGRILRDNVYGTLEEDVERRDFTINALYYNIDDFSIVDRVGGVRDIEAGVIRLLGDPETRYREDAVRALRAARFAAKLEFELDPATAEPLERVGEWLAQIPPARLFEEVLKLFQGGYAVRSFDALQRYDLLQHLFAALDRRIKEGDERAETLARLALENTDRRVAEEKPITPAFLYAALLWPEVQAVADEIMEEDDTPPVPALHEAADEVLAEQIQQTAIPRRFSSPAREIWTLQPRLEKFGKRAMKHLEHPRFRAAYDLMILRARAGEPVQEAVDWWTGVQESPEAVEQIEAVREADRANNRKRRRRRGGRRRGGQGEQGPAGD